MHPFKRKEKTKAHAATKLKPLESRRLACTSNAANVSYWPVIELERIGGSNNPLDHVRWHICKDVRHAPPPRFDRDSIEMTQTDMSLRYLAPFLLFPCDIANSIRRTHGINACAK